jgi:hypothetical protein
MRLWEPWPSCVTEAWAPIRSFAAERGSEPPGDDTVFRILLSYPAGGACVSAGLCGAGVRGVPEVRSPWAWLPASPL